MISTRIWFQSVVLIISRSGAQLWYIVTLYDMLHNWTHDWGMEILLVAGCCCTAQEAGISQYTLRPSRLTSIMHIEWLSRAHVTTSDWSTQSFQPSDWLAVVMHWWTNFPANSPVNTRLLWYDDGSGEAVCLWSVVWTWYQSHHRSSGHWSLITTCSGKSCLSSGIYCAIKYYSSEQYHRKNASRLQNHNWNH